MRGEHRYEILAEITAPHSPDGGRVTGLQAGILVAHYDDVTVFLSDEASRLIRAGIAQHQRDLMEESRG